MRAHRGGRVLFITVLVAVLGGGLVALLLLNTLSAQDAFKIQTLQASASSLADTEQALSLQVQSVAAPANLAAAAAKLGMVAAGPPGFFHLSGGRILAVLEPAPVAPPPPPPAPPAKSHPKVKTKAAAKKAAPRATPAPRPSKSPAGTATGR